MSVCFYITPMLQIETTGLSNKAGDQAEAIFHVKYGKVKGMLKFVHKSTAQGVASKKTLHVQTSLKEVVGAPVDISTMQDLVQVIVMNYQGITDVIGTAYLNGFFESEF